MKRQIEFPRQKSMAEPVVLNPFYHRLELSKLDTIKIALMSVTIAPVRLLMVGILLLMVWPLAALGTAFRSKEDQLKPMTGWRWYYRKVMHLGLRGVVFFFGFHWVPTKGKPASVQEAPIVCCAPHSSFFDIFVAVFGRELPSGVSRADTGAIPIVGHIIRFTQPVLVSREDPNSRLHTIQEIQRRAQSGGKWPQIFIFPEGTCSNRTCLITFKGGAFFPGVPVQPVCLRYLNKLDTITWTWDGPGALKCLWYTLCQFNNKLEIEFLPVYHPSPEEINDPKLFANNVRKVMAESLQVPVTDHTYDDCRLMVKANKLKMPMAAGLVEFQKLNTKLGIKLEKMMELLDRFHTIDTSRSGEITLEQFAAYLRLPVTDTLKDLFKLYDRNQSGTIDFREYVIGLSLLANPANTDDTLQLAFKMWDQGQKGYITHDELRKILHDAFAMEDQQCDLLLASMDSIGSDPLSDRIYFEEFKSYALKKPEYAPLFLNFHQKLNVNGHSSSAQNGETVHAVWEPCMLGDLGSSVDGKLKIL